MPIRELNSAIVLLLLVVAGVPSAKAWSCVEQTNPQAVDSAAAIFAGKIVKVDVVSVTNGVSMAAAIAELGFIKNSSGEVRGQ